MNTDMSALNRRVAAMAGRKSAGPKSIPDPDRRYAPFPLNDMQQAYWIGRNSEIAGGGTAIQYYISFAMPQFDAARFNSALNALVARHDMLRVVVLPDGMQQVLRNPPPMSVLVEDISNLGGADKTRRLAAIVDSIWNATSDLGAWPQHEFRFTVTSPGGGGVLHCKLDMWCFDGRSSQIFFEELAALYKDPQTRLRPLELRFCDYMNTVWQEEQGETFARDLEYWKQRLKTLPPPPALPMRPGGAPAAPGGGSIFTTREHRIPQRETARILGSCARQGVSLTSFMASAYSDVLSFWSGQRNLTLNFPRFNRQLDWHPDINDMIGEFASFTLLECRHDPGSSFLDRTRQLQERMWADLEHATVSGLRVLRERIIQTGQPEMQAMPVVFTAMPDRRSSRDALEKAFAVFGDIVACKGATPQVWLDCQYFVLNEELCISWDSQEHVFPEGMIEAMFAEYIRTLTVLADEARWGDRHPVRIPPQQFDLRQAQNNVPMTLTGGNVLRLFAATAKRQPQRPALTSGATTISYGELQAMSLRLAAAIAPYAAQGSSAASGPACVAVALERGWEQLAAVMGIVAAGLAYVPLDPSLPGERMKAILAAASPCLVIGTEAMRRTPPGPSPIALLPELLDEGAGSDPAGQEKAAPGPGPDAPAYLIFTSGSTGVPKGVTVGHDALLNLVQYSNARFRLGPGDVVFGATALHHDLSVYDIFGTLSAGAHLVLPSATEALAPGQWAALAERHGVTFWNSVPVYMEQLLAHAGKLPALRTVVLGGDWVDPGIVERLKRVAPGASLHTIGGPTETTVWNIVNKVESVPPGWESLPYGRPIDNASYHILDEDLADVPDWTPGEMFCGGLPLCQRASLDDAENARAFATHPVTGERIYRTGDLGRYRPDGMIEILGRKDFQLNINGYRLDPGEVEQAIARHDEVRRVVVSAHDGRDAGQGRLAVLTAFVTPAAHAGEGLERRLSQWSNELLPAAMRPRRWVLLEAFPVTPNGKVDRKALRELAGQASVFQDDAQRPPGNPVEALLLELWREVLAQDVPGVRSSFFELGGDSLKAVQTFARVEKRLGIRLSLAQIFMTPTIEGLAEEVYREVERALAGARTNEAEAAEPQDRVSPEVR